MEPGTGVRTIGGMYAVVKEVNEETVLLELTDGVHAHFAKNAIAVVLGEDEFNRIVHGIEPEEPEGIDEDGGQDAESAAEASSADDTDAGAGDAEDAQKSADAEDAPVDLGKSDTAPEQKGTGAARDAQ
jgi:preprotein translocase subunit YajC